MKIATLSPKDANDLIEFLTSNNPTLLIESLAETAGRLEPALSRSPADLLRYTHLRNALFRTDSAAEQAVTDSRLPTLSLLALGQTSDKLSKQLAFHIPRRNTMTFNFAQEVSFSLYLANNTREDIADATVSLSFTASFLANQFQGSPIVVEPFDEWRISGPAPDTIRCTYRFQASAKPTVIQPTERQAIGTVRMLVPWGEADGGPVEMKVPYRIDSLGMDGALGNLFIFLWPALNMEEAQTTGQVMQVSASLRSGITTDYIIDTGQMIQFVASGIVSLDDGVHFVNADGLLCDETGQIYQPTPDSLSQYEMRGQLLPQAPAGVLLAWIGEWSEQNAFYVGSSNTVVAEASGPLHLAVNDLFESYDDNTGSYHVGIKVT